MTQEHTPDTLWLAGTWNEEGELVADVNAYYSINTRLPYVAIGDWFWQGDEVDKFSDDEYTYMVIVWDNEYCRYRVDGYGPQMYRNEGSGKEFTQSIHKIDEQVIDIEDLQMYIIISNIHDQ